VILSSSTAKKLFPNENPLGRQIFFGVDNGIGLPAEVIGVVGDVRSRQLSKTNDVEFYRPWSQRNVSFFNVLVRTPMKPETAQTIVRAALDKIDKETPILQPNTLDAIVTQSLGQQRLTMGLLGAFAGIALLLAIVGIYGAVSWRASARRIASRGQAGTKSGSNRFDHRSCRNAGRGPSDRGSALSNLASQSVFDCRYRRSSGHSGPPRMSDSSTPRHTC